MISKDELAEFTDKDSKKPEYLKLYQEHDFVTAYAKHTDERIEADGPQLAIGAKADGHQDWDIHGELQLRILKFNGLEPTDTLLDLGCGTGRLAEQAIPYLGAENYVGIDISQGALAHAQEHYDGTFLHSPDGRIPPEAAERSPDVIWAHSVFTHNPDTMVEEVFHQVAEIKPRMFLFTAKLVPEEVGYRRVGLKQFQYSVKHLQDLGKLAGLKIQHLEGQDFPAGQKTIKAEVL